jgi:hypothetical protein
MRVLLEEFISCVAPPMSIYVEVLVRAPLETLWAHTQTPELHERWDLRFSRIDYLPQAHESEPQRFRYTTRVGLGRGRVVSNRRGRAQQRLGTAVRVSRRFDVEWRSVTAADVPAHILPKRQERRE